MYTDTHCHIHESSYSLDTTDVLERAHQANVDKLICVGTNEKSSKEAIAFAHANDKVFAAIGVHPHESQDGWKEIPGLLVSETVVAIGEIGLDYFYTHSPRAVQIVALEAQIQLALDHNLPIIFHVRGAFDDFWPIIDNFHGIVGELHSFTDSQNNLEAALSRGLLIGVNGISVFTKDKIQQAVFAAIPVSSLLLETDSPFLTPPPFRGKVNEPAFVRYVAQHHAMIRGLSQEKIAIETTANATALFAL